MIRLVQNKAFTVIVTDEKPQNPELFLKNGDVWVCPILSDVTKEISKNIDNATDEECKALVAKLPVIVKEN